MGLSVALDEAHRFGHPGPAARDRQERFRQIDPQHLAAGLDRVGEVQACLAGAAPDVEDALPGFGGQFDHCEAAQGRELTVKSALLIGPYAAGPVVPIGGLLGVGLVHGRRDPDSDSERVLSICTSRRSSSASTRSMA